MRNETVLDLRQRASTNGEKCTCLMELKLSILTNQVYISYRYNIITNQLSADHFFFVKSLPSYYCTLRSCMMLVMMQIH